MTIVGNPDAVVGGVDTHADVHVAAVVNHLGGVLGVESFSTTSHGYRQLVSWLRSHGELVLVGVEGTLALEVPAARFCGLAFYRGVCRLVFSAVAWLERGAADMLWLVQGSLLAQTL